MGKFLQTKSEERKERIQHLFVFIFSPLSYNHHPALPAGRQVSSNAAGLNTSIFTAGFSRLDFCCRQL